MLKYKIILLFILFSTSAFAIHKYYISLTKVEYKSEEQLLQITMRIFIDDIQEVINTTYSEKLEFDSTHESQKIDSLVKNYIDDTFKIKINSKLMLNKYLGKEYDNDVLFFYLEIENIKSIHTIEIENKMLTDMFSNQKNIIKLSINNIKKTFFLTKENDTDKLAL